MPGDVYEGRCYLGPPAGQTLIQVLVPGSRWGMFTREGYARLEMFVNKLCMPGDVYEGRCYLGPPTGQTLIQVLVPGSRWGMFTREALSSI